MIRVGIYAAKDRHDCFVFSAEGKVPADVFTVPNNREGFKTPLKNLSMGALRS